MKTILVPVDFSPTTRQVIAAAHPLAEASGAQVTLLHVIQPPLVSSDYGLTIDMMREALVASQKTAAKQLAHVEQLLVAQGLNVTTRLIEGFPPEQIVEQARRLRAAYIVMGSHGHTALYELLVGSTAHAVLKHTPCPVLIVPSVRQKAKKRESK